MQPVMHLASMVLAGILLPTMLMLLIALNRDGAEVVARPLPSPRAPHELAAMEQLATPSFAAAAPRAAAASAPPAIALIETPLPQCLVGVFVHVDKTGGTSVRSLLQAQAAHGDFEVITFGMLGATPFWKVLVQNLAARAAAQTPVRLLIELHAGGSSRVGLWKTNLPDLFALRSLFASRFAHLPGGCPVRLATMFRKPLEQALSLHHYAVYGRAPLCLWPPPSSLQLRLFLGLSYGSARARVSLTAAHARAALGVLRRGFDAVGTLEAWWESMLAIIDAFGLQRALVPTVNVASGGSAGARLSCGGDARTLAFVRSRLNSSARTAELMGRVAARAGDTELKVVACKSMGCLLPDALVPRRRAAARSAAEARSSPPPRVGAATAAEADMFVSFDDRRWAPDDCAHARENAAPERVLARLCAAARFDHLIYSAADATIGARAAVPRFAARAEGLRAANAATSGIDAMAASCPSCHVGRDSMLDECWRRLATWVADPRRFACERQWQLEGRAVRASPGARWMEPAMSERAAPCLRTCWTALGASNGSRARRHCSAACDGDDAVTARSLPASPLPPAERRAAIERTLRTPPRLWYAGAWAESERPRLLASLDDAELRRDLLAPLAWDEFELFDGGRKGERAPWPPAQWAVSMLANATTTSVRRRRTFNN